MDKRIIDGGKMIKKETKKNPVEARNEREDEAC